eukprot:gene30414-35419_t
MDFDQFKTMWEAKFPMPASWNTNKKMKNATQDEMEHFCDNLPIPMDETREIFVPKLRAAEYVLDIISRNPRIRLSLASTLPFDVARSYCFLPMRRSVTPLSSGQFMHTDTMKHQCDGGKEESGSMMADLAAAFQSIFDLKHGELLIVTAKGDDLATSRLVLPSLVDTLRQRLSCAAKDHLVVVPFATNVVFATRSSSPIGCCMMGDYADELNAAKDQADYLTSVPFRVAKIDRSRPVAELVAMGLAPVTWEFYPYWGDKPSIASIGSDGKVQFSVPGSEKQADEFMADVTAGRLSKVVPLADDDRVKRTGSCSRCFKPGKFPKCSGCKLVSYCSRDCQKGDWKLHKLKCKS